MPLPTPIPGLVIHYSYLWADENRRGLEEGSKDRPCVIVSAPPGSKVGTVVLVAPITHLPPRRREDAVEISAIIKKHLGMDDQRSWIMVNEINRFHWPGPDLRPVPTKPHGEFTYGVLPPSLFQRVKDGLSASVRDARLATTARVN